MATTRFPFARLGVLAAAIFAFASASSPAQEKAEGKWISLFNGKDLTGWTVKLTKHDVGVNFNDTFRVEDGVLKVSYDKYKSFDGQFGHLYTKEKFSHYRLRVEYRFVGKQCPGGPGWAVRNSGAMLHAQSPESMRKDQEFPVSVELQYLGGDGKNKRPTANMCSPGTHVVMDGKLIKQHCVNSKSDTFHGDQWVTVEAEVHGSGKIRHFVNGKLVMEYEQTQYDDKDTDAKKLMKNGMKLLSEGHIALQAESHPIEFRKVEIMILPKE